MEKESDVPKIQRAFRRDDTKEVRADIASDAQCSGGPALSTRIAPGAINNAHTVLPRTPKMIAPLGSSLLGHRHLLLRRHIEPESVSKGRDETTVVSTTNINGARYLKICDIHVRNQVVRRFQSDIVFKAW
jgi:hypothetical protein